MRHIRGTILMSLLCLAGALLNIALNILFAGVIALPLYMDTVFTISVTLAGGLFWGILCGALTNLIGHTILFWGWAGYLFILCNVATAVITAGFVRFFPRELSLSPHAAVIAADTPARSRRLSIVMNRMVVIILLSFCLCIAMSVLGGSIAAFIQALIRPAADGQIHNPASATLSPIISRQNLPVILTEILSRIPVNVIDRLVSAFGGYGIALAGSKIFLCGRGA